MAPKDLHSQIPGTWDYATLHRKSREGSACCKGQTRETAISEWCTGAAWKIYTMEIINRHTRDSLPAVPLDQRAQCEAFANIWSVGLELVQLVWFWLVVQFCPRLSRSEELAITLWKTLTLPILIAALEKRHYYSLHINKVRFRIMSWLSTSVPCEGARALTKHLDAKFLLFLFFIFILMPGPPYDLSLCWMNTYWINKRLHVPPSLGADEIEKNFP